MTRRKHRRTLVPIMMLALAVAAADPPPAGAAPKSFSEGLCEDLGHGWPGSKDCKTCTLDGQPIPRGPGTKISCTSPTKPAPHTCTCNGTTGQWDESPAVTQPPLPHKGPAAPLPLLTPQGPAAPLPQGGTERR
jgi:hypothetical protein